MINESAVKIEKVMELILSLHNDLAEQMEYINTLEEKNTILNTIKDINYYMGNSLELEEMIKNIIDVVLGVLGVTACSICINKESGWEITEQSIFGGDNKIITQESIKEVDLAVENNKGEISIRNLSLDPTFGLDHGAFTAIGIKRNNTKYGLIAIYYKTLDTFSDSKLEFFRLMSGQLGVHFENAFLFEKVTLSSITDGLTGLYNRVYLNQVISNPDFCNSKDLGIIMADLDNFKGVNDKYGHIFGDLVLKHVSGIFKAVGAKYKASVYRYGGEEFLLIFDKSTNEDLINAAEEIRINFEKSIFNIAGNEDSFTLSLGMSKMCTSCRVIDIFKLINLADDALYVAKNNGKNRSIMLDGNLDLYLKSRQMLSKHVSKFKRLRQSFTISKIDIKLENLYSGLEYNKIIDSIGSKFREYDMVFFNYLGQILVISENKIEKKVLNEHMKDIDNYTVDSLSYNNEAIDIKEFFNIDDNID